MTSGRILPLQAGHAGLAAAIHAAAMAAGTGDPAWDAPSIATLAATPGTFGLLLLADAGAVEPAGFVLARIAADEAEILTLAVVPAFRRRGMARTLMEAAIETARRSGAERLLLEVAVDNAPARGLYAALGFGQVGARRGYYRRGDGTAADCLVLSLELAGHPADRLPASAAPS